jgi:Tat protein secretion system quality control protein TatD with DNase activity
MKRAKSYGVQAMIFPCRHLDDTKIALEVCEEFDDCYTMIGLLPTYARMPFYKAGLPDSGATH